MFFRESSAPVLVALALTSALLGRLRDLSSRLTMAVQGRWHSEASLRASEVRFRALSEHGADLIQLLDAGSVCRYANPAHHCLLGWAPADLEGRPLSTFVHPEDWPCVQAHLLHPKPMAGAMQRLELRYRHADGSWRDVEVIGRNRLDDPAVRGIILNGRDISERRREEEMRSRLAAIVDSSADAIIGKNLEGVIESWNSGAERLYGYSAAEAIGRHVSMLIPAERSYELALFMGRITRGERVVENTTVRVRKDGSLVEVSLTVSPIHDGRGRVVGAATIARDIGERVLVLGAIERARQAAEEAARVRGDFVAAINHELRTPLTTIIGCAELLAGRWEALSEPRKRAHLDRIRSAAERQHRLVEDLLLASLDGPTLRPRWQVLYLTAVAQQAVITIQSRYPSQQVLAAGHGNPRIWGDTEWVLRILVHLLDNAAKHSARGGSIELGWAMEGEWAVVRVQDQGPGVPSHGRELLFSRFGRLAGSPIREGHVGTGLGLYLGRRLAEAMRGDLDLEATGSTGSTFRLRLLRAPDEVESSQGA